MARGPVAKHRGRVGLIASQVLIVLAIIGINWRWMGGTRRSYSQLAHKLMSLPPDATITYAREGFRPMLVGPDREVRILEDASKDEALRGWIAAHNGISWKATFPSGTLPLGEWTATKRHETFLFDRLDEEGSVSVSRFTRLSDVQAASKPKGPASSAPP